MIGHASPLGLGFAWLVLKGRHPTADSTPTSTYNIQIFPAHKSEIIRYVKILFLVHFHELDSSQDLSVWHMKMKWHTPTSAPGSAPLQTESACWASWLSCSGCNTACGLDPVSGTRAPHCRHGEREGFRTRGTRSLVVCHQWDKCLTWGTSRGLPERSRWCWVCRTPGCCRSLTWMWL